MANSFWRWKDASCNGKNIEWEKMSGEDFFAFLRSEQSNGRYFIRLNNDICPESDIIFIEAEKPKYTEWYKEYRHHRYLVSVGKGIEQLSMDCPYDDEGDTLHDIVADLGMEVETEAMKRVLCELLHNAISQLSKKQQAVVIAKYFSYPVPSDSEAAKKLSITEAAFSMQRFRAIQEMRKFFEKIVK